MVKESSRLVYEKSDYVMKQIRFNPREQKLLKEFIDKSFPFSRSFSGAVKRLMTAVVEDKIKPKDW